jgi:hypothetical protein
MGLCQPELGGSFATPRQQHQRASRAIVVVVGAAELAAHARRPEPAAQQCKPKRQRTSGLGLPQRRRL